MYTSILISITSSSYAVQLFDVLGVRCAALRDEKEHWAFSLLRPLCFSVNVSISGLPFVLIPHVIAMSSSVVSAMSSSVVSVSAEFFCIWILDVVNCITLI